MDDPLVYENVGRYVAAGIAIAVGATGSAIGMGMTARHASEGMMRQPASQGHLLRTMLIGQAVGSDPSLFALVIGLIILYVPTASLSASGLGLVAVMMGAALCIGLGCLGSGLGCGWPAGAACDSTSRNPRQATKATQIMIVGQAMTQSPCIFATVVALSLLFVKFPSDASLWHISGIAFGAGLAMGLGALGPGIGLGLTARSAVAGAGAWPQNYGSVLRTMLLGQAMGETPGILAILVALIMLFAMPATTPGLIEFATALGAGLAVGIGGIGAGIGSGFAGSASGAAVAEHPHQAGLVMRTLLIGLAVVQSTAIYALIVALVILYVG